MSRVTDAWAYWFGLVLVALVVGGCAHNEIEGSTSGETHFLKFCDPETAAPCGSGGLDCVCNTCTLPCDGHDACSSLPGARCVDTHEMSCSEAPGPGLCAVQCFDDRDCVELSDQHSCVYGICRAGTPPAPAPPDASTPLPPVEEPAMDAGDASPPEPPVVEAGPVMDAGLDAFDASMISTPEASVPMTPMCEPSGIDPNEVLIIGDSFFGASHEITGFLEELGRESGVLTVGGRYRDNSRLGNNALGLMTEGIANQYTQAVEESPVRVVIMSGGGADSLFAVNACNPIDSSCSVISQAVVAAGDLLARMAEDEVTDVVYVFYPDPQLADVKQVIDVLRPLLMETCLNAAVPCHWIDLRPTFEGHYGEYITGDGLNPTTMGAAVTADEIWAVMQDNCIAQ